MNGPKRTSHFPLRAAVLLAMPLATISLFHQDARAETSDAGGASATKEEFLE